MYYITGKIDKLLQQNLPACVYIVEQASSLQLKESGKAGRREGGKVGRWSDGIANNPTILYSNKHPSLIRRGAQRAGLC